MSYIMFRDSLSWFNNCLKLNKTTQMMFNIQKNHVYEYFILLGHTKCCDSRINYCYCVIIEKVASL